MTRYLSQPDDRLSSKKNQLQWKALKSHLTYIEASHQFTPDLASILHRPRFITSEITNVKNCISLSAAERLRLPIMHANQRDSPLLRLPLELRVIHYNRVAQENAIISPLLGLPAELRNMIYEYAFAGGVTVVIPPKYEKYVDLGFTLARALNTKFKGDPHTRQSKNAFGLRFACRQLYNETDSAFYHSDTCDLIRHLTILKAIDKNTSQHLSHLEVIKIKGSDAVGLTSSGINADYHYPGYRCLYSCFPKLQSLEASTWEWESCFSNPMDQARQT